jgi:hypothetical protein
MLSFKITRVYTFHLGGLQTQGYLAVSYIAISHASNGVTYINFDHATQHLIPRSFRGKQHSLP